MLNRRQLLSGAALLAAGTALSPQELLAQLKRADVDPEFVIKNGRIRQSIMGWCFRDHFNAIELAKHCKAIGFVGMEGIPRDAYPEVKKLGLDISLVSSHGFAKGPCNPENHDEVVTKLNEAIDAAIEVNCPSVITFTGMRFDGMDDEKAAQNCIDTWKEVLPKAEKAGITLVLEHLNSRDDSHPMKGHPGYFGDDVDFCVDLINQIGSPNFKLLFDIYHVSVMNGDVIRRIRQYKDLIGHYHTAGNPGRAEMDNTQELNYPPILAEIVKTGYKGFVAQEFIPTWNDPVTALRHAAQLCDV
ncbi:TIM barrel protein [Verrucomicrobiales bacterium]|jgi:hydroxypyruvate isomerase|nr:TIM barrel protein [Verrucomicrobiales bacterium]MDB2496421.1 TIM barrel protein [Verrucomicrobiales bacterium]MDB3940002.1 TIM barrel protein [Verrucomicrobiales bacterium]